MMRVRNNSAVAAEIPAKPLADEAPLYSREALAPTPSAPIDLANIPEIDNREALRQLLRDPSIASKNWVYRQYDHMVRTGTVVLPGSDAAVFRVREANKILAATTDCNSLYCRLDPREGARIAVAEAARNLTCSGAIPLAVTDNLNFGNPYKPEIFWQLREAVEGMAETCRAFATPVIGGNVSLYNESPAGAVDPTPTVAMVGLISDEPHITTQFFKTAGDVIILVGEIGHEMGATHFLKVCHRRKEGLPPRLDLERELAVQHAVRALIQARLIKSAHDCSEGGLAVALAECCFNPDGLLGAEIDLCSDRRLGGNSDPAAGTAASTVSRSDQILFNESQSRIIISVAQKNLDLVLKELDARKVPAQQIGNVRGNKLLIESNDESFRWPVTDLYDDWFHAIHRAVEVADWSPPITAA